MQLQIPEIEELRREVRAMREEVKSLVGLIEPQKEMWDTQQVADYYGVRPKTVRTWVAEGRLEAVRVGRKMAFDPDTLPKTPRQVGG